MTVHFKRAAAAMLAAMTLLSAHALPVGAEEQNVRNIVVIGDSISSGRGLDRVTESYPSMVGRYYHAKVTNLAADSCTTTALLETLDKPEVQAQLSRADMILFTVGMEDLLTPFLEQLDVYKSDLGIENINDLYTAKRATLDISDDELNNYSLTLGDKLQENEKSCEANILEVGKKLAAYKDNAVIVCPNTYNCLNTIEGFSDLNFKRQAAYKSIMNPCTWVTDTANASYSKLAADYGFQVVDIGAAYKGLAYQYTGLNQMQYEPNAAGHLMIAGMIVGKELAEVPLVSGDLTRDDKVGAEDAAELLVAAAKMGSGGELSLLSDQLTSADVNGDGAVDASDASMILQYAAAAGSGTEKTPWEFFGK